MKRTVLSIAIWVLCLAAWGCPGPIEPEKPTLTPEKAAEARRIIVAWLECEECTDGELEAVVKLGVVAVPSLAASLREGPSPASRELLRRHLITSYQKLKKYEATHPEAKVPMGQAEYVKTYMDNYLALYQVRAATALAAIGGSDAKRALEKALKAPVRNDVRAAIIDSLKIGTWPTPEKPVNR